MTATGLKKARRRGHRDVVSLGFTALFTALLLMPSLAQAAAETTLVSRGTGVSGVLGDGGSFGPSPSSDGRLIAFSSQATNLDPADGDSLFDVFARDLLADTTVLVSRADGTAGAKGNGESTGGAMSANGRYVAFSSSASNLHPDDADTRSDVFVRDLQTDTTSLVSRADGAGGAKGDGFSLASSISSDGRYVAFVSTSTNLHPQDADSTGNIFVRDLQTNTTVLVDRATGASGAKANGAGFVDVRSISADGRFVAFQSEATNLDPADADAGRDVYVRDLQTNTTTLISRASGVGGGKGDDESFGPAISADGRWVGFQSEATNLDPDDPDISSDVFVRDRQTDTTILVSRASGAAGVKADNAAFGPSLSGDGGLVAFSTSATNFDPDDTDGHSDVYVRDLQTNTTTLISRASGAAGVKGDSGSDLAAVSDDGSTAAFNSFAGNLHPDDTNGFRDVFARVLSGATVTVADGTITYNAGAGETNSALIVKQETTPVSTIYFVGDRNPDVTVTASAAQGCLPTPAAGGLPPGYLCTVPNATPITSLVENLADGNDIGVISAGTAGPPGTINGGPGDDTLVGGTENDTFNGGADTDSVAYVGISAANISRTANVTAALPTGASPTTGNGQAGENDTIAADIEGLTGGNGDDNLTGNAGPNTIAGSAPAGTPDVDPQPPGTESLDVINGLGGDDTLVAGDTGTVNGGDGADTVVGGRSFANVTAVNGGNNDDTLVSGTGGDNLTGGAGANTLAYFSVSQGGINVVSRSVGVHARLPEPGATASGGRIGGQENDVIHDDLRTLIGSNHGDFLVGSNVADSIVGAAPVGTGSGVVETPAGTDTIYGREGDDSLVGGDRGLVDAGAGADTIVGGRSTAAGDKTVIHGAVGNDTIVSGLGNDEIFGDAGSNTLTYASFERQGLNVVDRGTNGVTARLPNLGLTATGGRTSGPEQDIIHDDIATLVGGNGNDVLQGNDLCQPDPRRRSRRHRRRAARTGGQ